MNIKYTFIMGALTLGMFACGGEKPAETKATETEAEKMTYAVDAAASTVAWSGGTSGVMVYGHNGVIAVKEGSLEMTGDKVVGGSVTIDMTTIQPLDSGYNEENPAEKLVGHLSSGDFFMVEENPTASFVIKSMEGNTIKGDLTVRGKTNEETVTDVVVENTDNGVSASGKLVFDRQKYDVAWKHFMQDVILSNDITLDIMLKATK